MELLMNDPRYVDYFSSIIPKVCKTTLNKEEYSYQKTHLKTEKDDYCSANNKNTHNYVRERLHTESSKKSLLSAKMNNNENIELEEAKSKMRLLEAKLSLAL